MVETWNRPLWDRLQGAALASGAAVLLAGPRGVGKRSLAHAVVKAVLCPRASGTDEACGDCTSCRLFEAGSDRDCRLVEPVADDPSVDAPAQGASVGSRGARVITGSQVRDLSEFLNLTPHLGGGKVVLIQPADRMHASAANALLKT